MTEWVIFQFIFVLLKSFDKLDLSWFWVMMPTIIVSVLSLIIIVKEQWEMFVYNRNRRK